MFQGFDVPRLSFSSSNPVEDLQHPFGANSAGGAFSAGFLLNKVQIEPGGIHHAGVLVHDNQTAGPHNRTQRGQGFIVQRRIDIFRSDTAAGRTARLRGFELLSVGNPPTDGINHLRQRGPHGHFYQTGVDNVAGKGKYLCARALLRPELTEPVCPLQHNGGHGGQGFHVVNDGGLAKQTALEGERRFLSGFPSLPFHRRHQRSFLTTDESTCANPNFDVKVKTRAEDIFPQQAFLPSHLQCRLETFHGNGILRPDIYNAVGRANGIAADEHSLNDTVGVSLKDRAVHKRAGVPFVSVTNDVLFFPRLMVSSFPFDTSGESCAATAPEAGPLQLFNDRHPVTFFQNPGQSQITIFGDIAIDAVDINQSAIPQRNADLVPEKGHIMDIGDPFLLNAVIESIFCDRFSPNKVLLHNIFDPLRGHLRVISLIGQDVDHRAHRTGPHAASFDHGYFVRKSCFFQLFHHGVPNIFTAGRHTSCTVAYHAQVCILPHLFQIGLLHLLKVCNASNHPCAPPSASSSTGSSY